MINPPEASSRGIHSKPNGTGLPDALKTGVESLSGLSLDHVRVHRNSSKPAQLNALAYAQGSEIHLGPGQEQHLPHEAWHVVQQARGRVRPTLQAKSTAINDDPALEREADAMGARAAQLCASGGAGCAPKLSSAVRPTSSGPVQRAVGFEFQTYNDSTKLEIVDGMQPRDEGSDDEEASSQEDELKSASARDRVEMPSSGLGLATTTSSTLTSTSTGLGLLASPSSTSAIASAPRWVIYSNDVEERYAQGNGVKIEKDGADLEFVTNAFPETDAGRASLTAALRTVLFTALGLENRTTLTSQIHRLAGGLGRTADARDTVRVVSNGPMKAQVQATVGVKLDALDHLIALLGRAPKRDAGGNLGQLFDTEVARPESRQTAASAKKSVPLHVQLANEIGNNAGNKTQQTFLQYVYPQAERFAAAMMANVPREAAFAKLPGILRLVGLYIFGTGTGAKYAKGRTPIISRTNLADVIFRLPAPAIAAFAKEVLPLAGKYLESKKISVTGPMYKKFPYGETDAVGLHAAEMDRFTIAKWLTGLVPLSAEKPGKDILEEFEGLAVISNEHKVEHPDPADYRQKWFSAEYGAGMEASTDIGARERLDQVALTAHRVDGIVLELRNLGHDNLDLSEWATFATSLFDLILLVNSDSLEHLNALSQAMLEQRSFESDLGDVRTVGIFARARELLANEH